MAVRIGASDEGGTFHTQARAIAALLDHSGALPGIRVLPSAAASIENADRLERGELEFGFMASNWIEPARRGLAPFRTALALRVACPANAGPLFFVVLAGAPIASVPDLAGKRVAVGPPDGGMAQHARVMFGALGIDYAPVHLGFADGADALAAGEIDAQLQCPIPNRVITGLSERADIRVLPYADGQIEALLAESACYRPTVMRRGALRGVDADVDQVAVVNVIATHERVDEETVYRLVKGVVGNPAGLARRNPLFAGLDALFEPLRTQGAAALAFGGVPLHAGALRAYREAGYLR